MYQPNVKVLSYLRDEARKNQKSSESDFSEPLERLTDLLNAQYDVFGCAAWTIEQPQFSGRGRSEVALVSCMHAGAFLFFSATELATKGLYGPAGALLRNILEAQIIAKYTALSCSDTVFNRWNSGDYVPIVNAVLNKLEAPTTSEMRRMWKALNELSHASIHAQQVDIKYTQIKGEISRVLSLIQILAVANQHVLGTHMLTPQTIRFVKTYGDADRFAFARQQARLLVGQVQREFTDPAKQFLKEYRSRWELKR